MAFRCKTQVSHINLVPLLPHPHQAVLRLDVSMNDTMGVDILQPTNELVGEHQDCFEGEFATTIVEKVFQTRAQQIEHHGVIFALGRIGVDSWNTSTTRKRSIDVGFAFEKGRINGCMFELDGNLVTRVNIGSLCAIRESQEAAVTRRICCYLCTHRRSCHHRSSFATDTYRPHVNPDIDESSVYALSVLQTLVEDNRLI